MTPPQHIPLIYRLLLLYVEPVLAFSGAIKAWVDAVGFLKIIAPDAVYHPETQILFDQLGGTYILFAFNEAVVLRLTNQLAVWKAVVFGILLCDSVHLASEWKVLGTDMLIDPRLWGGDEWMSLGMLWIPLIIRVAFLLGIGLRERPDEGKKRV